MMKLMYKEAAADCDAALALDDGNAKAFFRKGKALLAGGKPQEAGAAFTAGLVKDPSNAGAKADRKTAEEVRAFSCTVLVLACAFACARFARAERV